MQYRIVQLFLILVMAINLPGCQESSQQNKTDRYPWQITILADGSSRIFGIQLGVTTLRQAKQQIGGEPTVALFENLDGTLSVEVFYKEFNRAGLTGRLVLTLDANNAELQGLKQQAVKKAKRESGVMQYWLDPMTLQQFEKWTISAMTYLPYANLEENIIVGRFGEPAEKIRSHEQAQHWLYPEKGLDLIINEAGKEVLQYVPPKEFEKLVKPLRR